MENFVLNLFSDQLSKIILDFHKSTINANFLSGKGSITNIKLNVDLINDFLNKPPHGTVPFLEFTEITLSELRVEVTSYTNLKKAPIVLVIEEIHAKAREPLEYHVDPAANEKHKKKKADERAASSSPKAKAATSSRRGAAAKQKAPAGPQPYGLLHRILDNLSIKIKRINLSFSPLGKFKSRRSGPWTPPTLRVSFDDVEWICVTEGGNPGTPDAVWAHNDLRAQQSRFRREASKGERHRSYTIYKRLSMSCHVKLLSCGEDQTKHGGLLQQQSSSSAASVSTLLTDTKVDVYLAYVRRLRDAGVTGADLDVLVDNIDINLDMTDAKGARDATTTTPAGCDLGAFAHMLVGILHCYYKDRSFVDPLLPKGVVQSANNDNLTLLRGFGGEEKDHPANKEEEEEEAGPDDFLPEVAMMDDDLDSSDESDYEEEPDEEHDEAYLAWKRTEDGNPLPSAVGDLKDAPEQRGGKDNNEASAIKEDGKEQQAPAKSYKRKRKAVIVIASGAQKFEKLSFSLSIPRINMKLCLPKVAAADPHASDKEKGGDADSSETTHHHCLEFLLEGLVAECIWPKNTSGEMGGHVQASIKYFHLLESAYRKEWGSNREDAFGPKPWNVARISPLLRIGTKMFRGHDAFSLSPSLRGSEDVGNNDGSKCDEFPLMEERASTWGWWGQMKGPRALAFKSTISFVDETLTLWSRTDVQHEASLGQFEVVLDSAPIERLKKLFSDPTHQHNAWFDERWLTGEWHAEIAMDMIDTGRDEFILRDHIQPLPSLYPSKSSKKSAPSSELRSITAHFDSITVRLPNPMHDISSFRMADAIFNLEEATILVSSALPSSFLSGAVTAENTSHEFPHDPSDISCVSGAQTADANTTFRMQISLTNCSLKVMPVQAYSLKQDELRFSNLIAPTNVTMMLSLEDRNAQEIPDGIDQSASHSLMLSILVHQLESNIELRSIYGALETFKYHAESIMSKTSSSDEAVTTQPKPVDEYNGAFNSFSIICIHVPDLEVNIWGRETQKDSLTSSDAITSKAQLKHNLLCRVKANQFEFGMEFTKSLSPTETKSKGAVYKCGISSVLVEVCSPAEDTDANFNMVEILSMGSDASDSLHLVEGACAFCFPDEGGSSVSKKGFFLRSENSSTRGISSIRASAVEIASPLSVDLNIGAIDLFLDLVGDSLLEPVFFGSRSHFNQIGQTSLGSAFWSIILKIYGLFKSPRLELKEGAQSSDGAGILLFRLTLHRMLLLVPSTGQLEDIDSFGVFFSDVKVAIGTSLEGNSEESANKYRGVIEKHCGHGGQTWLKEFHLLGERPANMTAYALRSRHTLIGVGKESKGNHRFNTILPESSINWSLPVGLDSSSSAPPFDVFAMKDLSMSLMNMGMPLSSLYFKLYKIAPQNESDQSSFSLAATRLHDSIGTYHCKISSIIGEMNSEVDRLRGALFSKENERVGALALASSSAAGWVRVGEDLSFSHRIFSSATFWRYWMVLDKSLLILYKNPGAKPSFVIPLRPTSHLRSLSMTSSSNKNMSGIVSNHIQQKGFAVFDSSEGTGLFFVSASDSDYSMWVEAISMVLKKEEVPTQETISAMNANDNDTNQSSDTMISAGDQDLPPESMLDGDNSMLSALDQKYDVPSSGEAQIEDPFGAFENGTSVPAEPPQAPTLDTFIGTRNHLPASEPHVAHESDPLSSFGVSAPDGAAQEENSPNPIASLESSDLMEDFGMEEISLDGSDKSPDAFPSDLPLQMPAAAPNSQTKESPVNRLMPSSKPSSRLDPHTVNPQSLPMRERLALAKGKSKMASSKFGSALKAAKGGVLAAGETSRDGIKQVRVKEAPRKEEPSRRPRAVGQKMSMLKRNASTKLAAARSSMQEHNNAQAEELPGSTNVPTLSTASSRDELPGNKKLVVGEKMSLLKKTASTKLNSLIQEQALKKLAADSSQPLGVPASSSQDEFSANRSGKQELRKKLANLDQSMSNTMRRLKIDEKMTQLSAAVKSGVKSDPMMRQRGSHSRASDQSKQRLGIGDETKSVKPIKFDARETFSASSELPLKVKSLSSGEVLLFDENLSQSIESLQKVEGSWAVVVDAIITVYDVQPLKKESKNGNDSAGENLPSSIEPDAHEQVRHWKYRIMTSDIASGTDSIVQASVERTMSEVLILHSSVSEIIAKHLPATAEVVSQEGLRYSDSTNPIFAKLSPIERLKVCGTLLQRILEQSNPYVSSSSSMRGNQCEMIKVFLSTLLECHMPEEALSTTKIFLNIGNSQPGASDSYGIYSTNGTHAVNEAFSIAADTIALQKRPLSHTNSLDLDPKCDEAYSSLLNVIMDGYTKAMKERDEALSSLATTSIINDNHNMKEQLGSKPQATKKQVSKTGNSDEDMINLCKQLGTEIASRTAAETEINRLNERLEFEQKIAAAKENELRAELATYKKGFHNPN